jgi:nucleoside-diphosphate-sugar epimerase
MKRIVSSSLPWDRLSGKTVLISGASGFVPAYMLETLLYLNEVQRLGVRVIALVRNYQRAMERLGHFAGRPDLTMVVQDVRDPYGGRGASILSFMLRARQVQVLRRRSAGNSKPTFWEPCGCWKRQSRRSEGFLLFSSGDVYGNRLNPSLPIDEQSFGSLDPINIRSCYGEGKRASETLCACWHAQFNVPAKIVRLSHTYGPGMRLDDGRVFADFVADIVAGRDIVLKSDGSALRPFCYLADATVAFFTVLLSGKSGEAYNVIRVRSWSRGCYVRCFERSCRVTRQDRKPNDPYVASQNSIGHFDISKTGRWDGSRRQRSMRASGERSELRHPSCHERGQLSFVQLPS